MEKKQLKRLPIGMQTFKKIIEGNYMYIDKTEYIWEMIHRSSFVFLSRPRRFGKSLLTTTMKSYFLGEKELFKGLAIEKLETEWVKYPVLHFDLSMAKHLDEERLKNHLNFLLQLAEADYDITTPPQDFNDRLTNLIISAYKKTGKRVVVLIDEYDAPLLDVSHEDETLPAMRRIMRNFYSPLKGCDEYLRFVFLTGITKFSQLSIFSELNNISNISMLPDFAAVCGITEQEMLTQLDNHIQMLATTMDISKQQATEALKAQYDGYHFTWPSPDIFNPFSLLNSLTNKDLNNYWFDSGTPTFLIEMLRKFKVQPSQIGKCDALASAFDTPTENIKEILPLMYQSGYLTIKDYNRFTNLYSLDIPNKEVRIGLMQSLFPNYVQQTTDHGCTVIAEMYDKLLKEDVNGVLTLLQQFLLTVPQCDNTHYEGHYQQMLYIIFSLFGMYVDVEVRTSTGRVDMVMRTATKLYLFELKTNRSAEAAIKQIDLKDYLSRFTLDHLPIVRVGINFDCDKHTITEWEIKELKKD